MSFGILFPIPSATERPESGGEEKAVSDYALPPEDCSTRHGSEKRDLEALVREAYEIMKARIEAEEGSTMETGPSGSGRNAEEGTSSHTKDEAYAEAGRDRYTVSNTSV